MSIFSGWTEEELRILKEVLGTREGMGYLALFAAIALAFIVVVVRFIMKSISGFTLKIQEEDPWEEAEADEENKDGENTEVVGK